MIRIIQTKPELSKIDQGWRNSQATPHLNSTGNVGVNSTITDNDIDAIANGFETTTIESIKPQNAPMDMPGTFGMPGMLTPEKAAELMIQNYIKQNGGVIVDNTKKQTNRLLLG